MVYVKLALEFKENYLIPLFIFSIKNWYSQLDRK